MLYFLPEVRIGDGDIMGLNSTGTKDVSPYTIVAGTTAKIIRERFDDELIDSFLKLKWWDKNINEIQELIQILTNSNLNEVKEQIKSIVNNN